MTAKDTLTAIIELEELKKDTATTRSVLCSAQKVLEADELGDEHVTELMTAVREKYSSMISATVPLLLGGKDCGSCSMFSPLTRVEHSVTRVTRT